jgi:RecJ-like exonuclease
MYLADCNVNVCEKMFANLPGNSMGDSKRTGVVRCSVCRGTGFVDGKKVCSVCKGTGEIAEKKK